MPRLAPMVARALEARAIQHLRSTCRSSPAKHQDTLDRQTWKEQGAREPTYATKLFVWLHLGMHERLQNVVPAGFQSLYGRAWGSRRHGKPPYAGRQLITILSSSRCLGAGWQQPADCQPIASFAYYRCPEGAILTPFSVIPRACSATSLPPLVPLQLDNCPQGVQVTCLRGVRPWGSHPGPM